MIGNETAGTEVVQSSLTFVGPVAYSATALQFIYALALKQFLSIPRGGLEVGGLLFGRSGAGHVEILVAEEFLIEHLSGPSFQLSETDEHNLAERLLGPYPERDGTPLELVGWWHSHTRTDSSITAEDIRVHRQFFTGPEYVALIVKPFKFEPAQVAVYQPSQSSGADAVASFTFGSLAEPRTEPTELAPVVIDSPAASITPKSPPFVLSHRAVQRRPARAARLITVISGLAIALAVWVFATSRRTPAPAVSAANPLQLTVSGTGAELNLRWADASGKLASARSAELTIVDGNAATRIPLGVDSLRDASLAYVRQTGNVQFRLRAMSSNNELLEAVTHYVGPAPVVAPPPPVPVAAPVAVASEPPKPLRAESMTAPQPQQPPQQTTRFRTLGPIRPVARTAPAADPQFVPPPSSVPLGTPAAPPPVTLQLPATQAPQAVPAPPVKRASGRAIWSGTLPRGGILLFDGRRPSSGTITGQMPQRPSRVRVYPADLTDAGIVVYTDGAKRRVEEPGPANGWNLTSYRGDARRSREVTVVEAPSQSNDWQRLMIRSEQRPISMLVVEWEELP